MDKQTELTSQERVIKAKITVNVKSSFFATALTNFNIKYTKDLLPTAGVDRYGNMFINEEFIKELTDDEICGLLCHEISHCIFLHLVHHTNGNRMIWNVAEDMKINYLIRQGTPFGLPKMGINPEGMSTYYVEGLNHTVENIDDKTTEEIYEELMQHMPSKAEQKRALNKMLDDLLDEHNRSKEGYGGKGKKDKKGDKNGQGGGSGDKDGKGDSDGGNGPVPSDKELEQKWKKVAALAATAEKSRGKGKGALCQSIDGLLEPEVNWRNELAVFMKTKCKNQTDWKRQSRKSRACGIYLPRLYGKKLTCVVHIDSSGSVWNEAQRFLSEFHGIIQSMPGLECTLIICDWEIRKIIDYKGNSMDEIREGISGGGGTSHAPVIKYVNENFPGSPDVFITLTDAYSDMEVLNDLHCPVLTVLTPYHAHIPEDGSWGKVIELKQDK